MKTNRIVLCVVAGLAGAAACSQDNDDAGTGGSGGMGGDLGSGGEDATGGAAASGGTDGTGGKRPPTGGDDGSLGGAAGSPMDEDPSGGAPGDGTGGRGTGGGDGTGGDGTGGDGTGGDGTGGDGTGGDGTGGDGTGGSCVGEGYTVRVPTLNTTEPLTVPQVFLSNSAVTGLVESQYTLEYWFEQSGSDSFTRLTRRGSGDKGYTLSVRAVGGGTLNARAELHGVLIHHANFAASAAGWHHLAWTFDDGASTLFFDGQPRTPTTCVLDSGGGTAPTIVGDACVAVPGTLPEAETTSSGAALGTGYDADGNIDRVDSSSFDEVRYSDVVRYTAPFVPPRRHTVDEDTLALFHFDEGSGASSSNAAGGSSASLFGDVVWEIDDAYGGAACP